MLNAELKSKYDGGKTLVPNNVFYNFNLSIVDVRLHSLLCMYADKDGFSGKTTEFYMNCLKVSEPTLVRSLSKLERQGLIARETRGNIRQILVQK